MLLTTLLQRLLPDGATLSPVIISTDKTQLTQFSGNKSAYPVYLTLGNIPRSIRRKPSEHACILLGYLPVSKVGKENLTKRERKARSQRLFHMAMRIILKPLVRAGLEGMDVTSGDGTVRRVYPVLAAYVADYPEQCLVTCSKYGTCPKCCCPADKLQDPSAGEDRTSSGTAKIIRDAWDENQSASAAEALCMDQDVAGSVKQPFWTGLPFADIHLSVTPDVLHQLYQGVFKHLVSWCQDLLGAKELDKRLRCLPPAFGTRHFKHGISALAQVSGKERKEMARILLGCLIGKIPRPAMLAFRSLLDFIYLAQYPAHDDATLQYLTDALKMFHKHKDVIVKLGIRDQLNIPKLHSLLHYVDSIRQFGATDNYNTEMFERLHIDFAKEAWRASNHRDEFPQMVRWISRREKMALYDVFQKERRLEEAHSEDAGDVLEDEGETDEGSEGEAQDLQTEVRACSTSAIKIAKYPPAPQQHLAKIQESHDAPGFTTALLHLINDLQPDDLRLSRRDLARTWLPFDRVDIYHKFQFVRNELLDGKDEFDVVKAIPGAIRKGRKNQFDTVIALENEEAESTGVRGQDLQLLTLCLMLMTLDHCSAP